MRGPGSVLYGTGAFSGVINVVTRPHDAPARGYEVGGGSRPATKTVGRVRARPPGASANDAGAWTRLSPAAHSSGTEYFFPEYAQRA